MWIAFISNYFCGAALFLLQHNGRMQRSSGLPLLPLSTLPSTNTQDSPAEPEETRREKYKKHIILSSLLWPIYFIIAPFYPKVGVTVTDLLLYML